MQVVETKYEHVILNEDNVPIIADTNTKVVELILDKIAYGWSPEELRFQHPHLTLGQIYSALAYYYDHQEILDRVIEQQLKHLNQMEKNAQKTPLIAKLKAKNLI